ncbi:MAG TPA: hypothetical protein VG537_01485 [Candidatus Kapabacteria bacterium]|nr:hypothetical protein [Candidatus Kapabacteria bacterium]
MKVISILILVFAAGCTRKESPPRPADSSTTANAVQQMQGKTMRTFRGPADILGDTTKNQRNPKFVHQK